MSVSRAPKRSSIVDGILWGITGVLGAMLLASVAAESRDGFALNRIGLAIGIALVSLMYLGLLLRWGPIVPCMILGMLVLSLLTPGIARSREEAVFKDLGVPLIGAVVGTSVGLALEAARRQRSKPKQHDGNGERSP
jgi:hypothetical protein